MGAFFVFAQSTTVGLLGVALFTVATVTGQTLSGLLVDRLGIGPGGKRSITGVRVIGSVLTVVAVAWAVSPRFGSAADVGLLLLLPVLLPLAAGFLMSFQQAMNGTATLHYGTPIAATLVNFVAGGPSCGWLADQTRCGGRRQSAAGGVVVLPWRAHGLHLHRAGRRAGPRPGRPGHRAWA